MWTIDEFMIIEIDDDGNHRHIADCYDPDLAPLLASAPDLRDALEAAEEADRIMHELCHLPPGSDDERYIPWHEANKHATELRRAALARAR